MYYWLGQKQCRNATVCILIHGHLYWYAFVMTVIRQMIVIQTVF